jgi:hypothetical protein
VSEWLSADSCAELLDLRTRKGEPNRRAFLVRIATREDFPAPAFTGRMRRWNRAEVLAWIECHPINLPTECNHPRADQPTCLYRHFAADGTLLYVGISLTAVQRLREHREDSHWYSQVSRIELQWLESRLDAIRAERIAIATERPKYNKAGRHG